MTAPLDAPVPEPADDDGVVPAPAAGADLSHDWVVYALVDVTSKEARLAALRKYYTVQDRQRIRADDITCDGCKRSYEDVMDQPCAAKIDNEHLIGGDQSTRKKRNGGVAEGAELVAGPRITRFGSAWLVGDDE